jgi:hemolysin III
MRRMSAFCYMKAVSYCPMWSSFRRIREPFSGLSHWFGFLLAVIGAVLLLVLAHGNLLKTVAFGIYGFSLIFLYLASSVYHSLRVSPAIEDVLRKFDHVGIFLLIAGTYVPVCLLKFSPKIGLLFLILQASCATIGIAGTFLLKKFPEVLNVILYLVMGWMSVFAFGYMESHWPIAAVGWLVGGGIIYTLGAIVFSLDKPNLVPGKFSAHDLWHLFVLGGSACHFIFMTSFVAKSGALA